LRPKLRVGQLGATVLSDLVGDTDIPRLTAGSSTTWVAEHGAVSASTPTFDTVAMTPKTVGAYIEVSRRMIINGHPGVEQILRADLSNAIATAIDNKAVNGDGTGNTPVGILNTSGRNTQSLATLSWQNILSMISQVEAADGAVGMEIATQVMTGGAIKAGPVGWLTNPYVVELLRSTIKITNSEHIMTSANELAGYLLLSSWSVPGDAVSSPTAPGTLIFANWSDLLVGYWSAVDITTNPYESSVFSKGGVLISALQDVDVAVRHPESFTTATDIAL